MDGRDVEPCRWCGDPLTIVAELGESPVSVVEPPGQPEPRRPLRVGLCPGCGLVQLADDGPGEDEHGVGRTSTASGPLGDHIRRLLDGLVEHGLVAADRRIATLSSHGGNLAPFLAERGIAADVLEPSPAWLAQRRAEGQPVRPFDVEPHDAAEADDPSDPAQHAAVGSYDAVVDLYLLAHLRSPRAAIARLAALVAETGALVFEFDHLLPKVEHGTFDAIRHGHRSYLTLTWLSAALGDYGFGVADATEHDVYGGALRVVATRGGQATDRVREIVAREQAAGVADVSRLTEFGRTARRSALAARAYLERQRARGRRVVGYGAPARAVTFLSVAAIDAALLPYSVDRSPSKHGLVIAGTDIPIRPVDAIADDRPDEVLVLAWDLVDEVRAALPEVESAGGRFVVALPELRVVDPLGRRPPD